MRRAFQIQMLHQQVNIQESVMTLERSLLSNPGRHSLSAEPRRLLLVPGHIQTPKPNG